MKRILILVSVLCLFVSGCGRKQPEQTQYTATFLTLFDTVTTVVGPAESKEAFSVQAQDIHDRLEVYHRLFDIYEEYDGINNLKTVNDQAGIAPVKVDEAIIAMLKDCVTYYEATGGRVNVTMGSVLSLWHEARTDGINDPDNAALPEEASLQEAADHIGIENLVIDEEASTVYLADPDARLDVGAIAKGWATEQVAEQTPEGMLISVGGNVCATGPKYEDGTPWVIGIMDPEDSGKNIHTIYVKKGSVVTSGDYQRTYLVDGTAYHHIIDPETLMPASYWRSVSIVCEDSGVADMLSTALFLLPLEEGKALAAKWNAEAFWIHENGEEYMTPGFENMIRT